MVVGLRKTIKPARPNNCRQIGGFVALNSLAEFASGVFNRHSGTRLVVCLCCVCLLAAHCLSVTCFFAFALAVRYLQSVHAIGHASLPLGLTEVSDLVTPAPTDGLRLQGLVTTY
jgi:hypothetical protein